jgi:hypothetical protein
MGRGWAILEGGNRGNVLMRSAVAVCYGDSSDRVAIGGDDSGGKLTVERGLRWEGITARRALWSSIGVKAWHFWM